jgi:hypothetical protein
MTSSSYAFFEREEKSNSSIAGFASGGLAFRLTLLKAAPKIRLKRPAPAWALEI